MSFYDQQRNDNNDAQTSLEDEALHDLEEVNIDKSDGDIDEEEALALPRKILKDKLEFERGGSSGKKVVKEKERRGLLKHQP